MGVSGEEAVYYPYFWGKQFELITIRENASLMRRARFVPIIDPIKEMLGGLERALVEVTKEEGTAIVVINPQFGEHSSDPRAIEELLGRQYSDFSKLGIGVHLRRREDAELLRSVCEKFAGRDIAVIHGGFPNGIVLAGVVEESSGVRTHLFTDECGKLYRRHFKGKGQRRVLLRDGFKKRNNRDYPPLELFSDLHATFDDEGMDAFGDYLVVGNDFSEGGGPAYAVALHLTCIAPDDQMLIHHFVSDRTDTPTDPAGKFYEALVKLKGAVERPAETYIESTRAVGEFLDLHERGHFPGLGYVKKLSMQHHLETLALYFARKSTSPA